MPMRMCPATHSRNPSSPPLPPRPKPDMRNWGGMCASSSRLHNAAMLLYAMRMVGKWSNSITLEDLGGPFSGGCVSPSQSRPQPSPVSKLYRQYSISTNTPRAVSVFRSKRSLRITQSHRGNHMHQVSVSAKLTAAAIVSPE